MAHFYAFADVILQAMTLLVSTALFSKVAHHEGISLVFLPKVLNCYSAGTHNLAREAILVDLAESCPLAKLFVIWYVNQGHVLLCAKPLDELLVRRLIARFCKHHHLGIACVQGLCNLMKSSYNAIHYQRIPEYSLACRHQICAIFLYDGHNLSLRFIVRHRRFKLQIIRNSPSA